MSVHYFNSATVIRPDTCSHAVQAGDQLHVGGVIGTAGPEPRLVDGGTSAQARQALVNMRSVLACAGAELAQVVRVQMFLTDLRDFPEVDAIFKSVFGKQGSVTSTLCADVTDMTGVM